MHRKRNRRIDLIHHQMDQPHSFGDFHHGTSRLLSRLETKLTCPSPTTTTTGGVRGPRFHTTNRRRGTIHNERRTRNSPNWKKHKLCLLPFHQPHLHVATERNDVAYSLLLATDDNGTPATWTLVLFQQAIDRQDRTTD